MIRRLSCLLAIALGNLAFAVTYTQDVKSILDIHCVECHDSLTHDPDLTEYPFQTEKFSNQSLLVDKVLARVTGKSMPPGNRPKLTQDEINKIQQWKLDGLSK